MIFEKVKEINCNCLWKIHLARIHSYGEGSDITTVSEFHLKAGNVEMWNLLGKEISVIIIKLWFSKTCF